MNMQSLNPFGVFAIAALIIAALAIVFMMPGNPITSENEAENATSTEAGATSTASVENREDAQPSPTAESSFLSPGTPRPSSGTTPSAPTPTLAPVTGASGPYLLSESDAKSALQTQSATLSIGAELRLSGEPGATLHFTNIGTEGDTAVARFEIRRGNNVERLSLPAGGTVASIGNAANKIVLEVNSINEKDDIAAVRIRSFPSTRLLPRVPATAWVFPRQTVSFVNPSTEEGIRITVLSVLERKAELSITEFEGATITRSSSQWVNEGDDLNLPKSFTVSLPEIRSTTDPAYISKEARWKADLVAITLRAK